MEKIIFFGNFFNVKMKKKEKLWQFGLLSASLQLNVVR